MKLDAPKWFPRDWTEGTEEPRPEELRVWVAMGHSHLGPELKPVGARWMGVFRSKDEAEASACVPSEIWTWDGNPAKTTTLAEVMLRARRGGLAGVALRGFRDGEWVTLKEWRADQPIGGDHA